MLFTTRKVILALFMLPMLSTEIIAQTENYSASECERRSGGAVALDFDGAMYNTSWTTRSLVVCHVPHTDFDGWFAGEVDNGWFQAIDLNNSQNLNCRFRSRSLNSNGSIQRYYGSMGYTNGFGTQRQHIYVGGVSEDAYSGYVFACDLPVRTNNGVTKLYTYRVNQ